MSNEYVGDSNFSIAKLTLKFRFKYIVFITNKEGEEKQSIQKIYKKDFLKTLYYMNVKVKLVESCPPEDHKDNVFYIKKDGKTVWLWKNELNGEN